MNGTQFVSIISHFHGSCGIQKFHFPAYLSAYMRLTYAQ